METSWAPSIGRQHKSSGWELQSLSMAPNRKALGAMTEGFGLNPSVEAVLIVLADRLQRVQSVGVIGRER